MRTRRLMTAGATLSLLGAACYLGLWCKYPLGVSASEPFPAELRVTGIVRDFSEDHPDFETVPGNGYGTYCGNIEPVLDATGKPVFKGGGFRVAQHWRDSQNRQICWNLYSPSLGDTLGKPQNGSVDNGAITSAATFYQWFHDVPGVNMSRTYTLKLNHAGGGMYEFVTNDFHPIDDALLGNDGDDKNLYFTFELVAQFKYEPDKNPVLEFMGDDDLWVFIDGKLVVDLGGIGGNSNQFVDLKRLNLTAGKMYTLHFFHAERKQPKSQFRFKTNILLQNPPAAPTISGSFD